MFCIFFNVQNDIFVYKYKKMNEFWLKSEYKKKSRKIKYCESQICETALFNC